MWPPTAQQSTGGSPTTLKKLVVCWGTAPGVKKRKQGSGVRARCEQRPAAEQQAFVGGWL